MQVEARMAADTLVLDSQGYPIGLTDWQSAITLWAKDRVSVIAEDPDHVLRSPSFEMNMPTVIQLKNCFARRMKREVPFSRRNVAIRDKGQCQYCGKRLKSSEWTYDHVLPRSRGGGSTWKNMVLACVGCNFFKADRLPEECGMSLINDPVKPDPNDKRFEFRLMIKRLKPEWEPWSSWLYWNVHLDE